MHSTLGPIPLSRKGENMSIFDPAYFLRHIGMPTLRLFVEHHPVRELLDIDWNQEECSLPSRIHGRLELLADGLTDASEEDYKKISSAIGFWFDDLRRCHLMANPLAVQEFQVACVNDEEALDAIADLDDREKAMWMFTLRDKVFRDTELHLSFLAKTNGKFWKKHRIGAGHEVTKNRAKLEAFSNAVARLYKKTGAGKSTHIEVTHRKGTIQLTLYVEGPVTAFAHFTKNSFNRITTRIALETALVYQPDSGIIETVVKGGAKVHKAVLQLFGEHVLGHPIKPEEIEPQRYRLNALRDGLEPFEDWEPYGIRKVRLRRATFTPTGSGEGTFKIEAPSSEDQPDAMTIARQRLAVSHIFETEYDLAGATIMVYPTERIRRGHFSFNIYASGSSTIKNLPLKYQPAAQAVLRALNIIDPEEVLPEPETEVEEKAVAV